ncbi:hypothetical protein [Prescottella subtropica]|uniref:hypothetical protein n=1 Tax=Prescottella subtropica TaxID=2545757 RepID=UPI0018848BE2
MRRRQGVSITDREFDLVLFGATGFAGGLTAHQLAAAAPAGARIALAGRPLEKLAAVQFELPVAAREWSLVQADPPRHPSPRPRRSIA